MSETGTYTVTKEQYNHLVERLKGLEHLPRVLEMANARAERWKRRHDLMVTSLEKHLATCDGPAKAEAWDEGYEVGFSEGYGEAEDPHAGSARHVNPYREA